MGNTLSKGVDSMVNNNKSFVKIDWVLIGAGISLCLIFAPLILS
jgi:hypothetical protein